MYRASREQELFFTDAGKQVCSAYSAFSSQHLSRFFGDPVMIASEGVMALPPLTVAMVINNGIQASIGLTFTAALLGAAILLRRPAMWSLCLCWGLFTAISLLISSVVAVRAVSSAPVWVADLPVVLLAAVFGAVYPATRHATNTIVDAQAAPLPPLRSVMGYSASAAGVQLGAVVLISRGHIGLGEPTLMLAPRAIGMLAASGGALHAWRAAKHSPRVRRELVLLAGGFGLLALRSPINAFVAYVTGNGPMFDGLSALVLANVLACVLVGMASLVAAMGQERTAYLAQAESLMLSEARQAQGVRMESLGRMAAGIAHDFNNVLMVIGSSVAMASETENARDQKVLLSEVQSAAARGLGLTKQLLSFARNQPSAPERIGVGARIQEILPLLVRLAGRDVQVLLGEVAASCVILLERSQFDQVLLNLIANARDAMPNGGVVQISVASADTPDGSVPSDGRVRLVVSDNGQGMSQETILHIFEPFFTTKPDGKGSGLGLATVYGIVQRAGGEIAVHSRAGEGTQFEILLPAVIDRA